MHRLACQLHGVLRVYSRQSYNLAAQLLGVLHMLADCRKTGVMLMSCGALQQVTVSAATAEGPSICTHLNKELDICQYGLQSRYIA